MITFLATTVPTPRELAWPIVLVLRTLGGSGRTYEIDDAVVVHMQLTEKQTTTSFRSGTPKLVTYLSQSRTFLKAAGFLDSSERGVWALTAMGWQCEEKAMVGITTPYQQRNRADRSASRQRKRPIEAASTEPTQPYLPLSEDKGRRTVPVEQVPTNDAFSPFSQTATEIEIEETEVGTTWRDELLGMLRAMPPIKFEHLVQRLREAGFEEVLVTQATRDDGFDGRGVYRVSLVSFPIFFECKRYSGSVGSPHIRSFRGAMQGRGDRGLFITTGTFTRDAREEASRDGSQPVDLIDGEALCELLLQHGLGAHRTEVIVVDRSLIDSV